MMVVNQVVDQAATDRFLDMRRRDQQRALQLLRSLPALRWVALACAPRRPAPPPGCTLPVGCICRALSALALAADRSKAGLGSIMLCSDVVCASGAALAVHAVQQAHLAPTRRELQVTEAKLSDLEITGVPALKYFGEQVWQ